MELAEIAQALIEMPNLIASEDSNAARWEVEIKLLDQKLETLETRILSARDDWGKNDAQRKINQAAALRSNPDYMSLLLSRDGAKRELATAKVEADRQRNRFYAYRAVAELMGAQLLGDRSLVSNGRRLAIGEYGL